MFLSSPLLQPGDGVHEGVPRWWRYNSRRIFRGFLRELVGKLALHRHIDDAQDFLIVLEEPSLCGGHEEPPTDRPVVFFDDDGREAIAAVERFHDRGFTNVKALFGGLDLWKFSLDPEIVGEETFLISC